MAKVILATESQTDKYKTRCLQSPKFQFLGGGTLFRGHKKIKDLRDV